MRSRALPLPCAAAAGLPRRGRRGDVELQRRGNLPQLTGLQHLGDGGEPLAAEPGWAAVVGERQQRSLLVGAQLSPAGNALGQQVMVPLQAAGEQGLGQLLTDPIAAFDRCTVVVGGAAPADGPGLSAALGIGVGGEPAALELLDQGQGHCNGRGDLSGRGRFFRPRLRRFGLHRGLPQVPQLTALSQGLGLVLHQPVQHRLQPGPMMALARVVVADEVAGGDRRLPMFGGFAHGCHRSRSSGDAPSTQAEKASSPICPSA